MRASTSLLVPAAVEGAMSLIVRDGYACACAMRGSIENATENARDCETAHGTLVPEARLHRRAR
jgi:hypothetical protein